MLAPIDRLLHHIQDVLAQSVSTPDDHQTNSIGDKSLGLIDEVRFEESHQEVEFVLGSFPVFVRKAIEGQVGDSEFPASGQGDFDGIGALAMSFDAWQSPSFGPSSVAIHDDCNVLGKASRIDGFKGTRMRIYLFFSTEDAHQSNLAKPTTSERSSAHGLVQPKGLLGEPKQVPRCGPCTCGHWSGNLGVSAPW